MSQDPPLLQAEHITVHGDGREIVSDCSLTVRAGEVLAILGPNGAGKTTLLKAVLGLVRSALGRVRAGGRDLLRLPADARARLVAYVPQRSGLQAALSVREVVAMGRYAHGGLRFGLNAADRLAIDQALATTDATALAGRTFATLSGGEQARVLIARALATEAQVILLDEPTASLDIPHAIDSLRCLRRLAAAGKGIGIVLHDLNQAREWTDRCLVMHHGRIAESGPTGGVITDANIAPIWGVNLIPGAAFGYRRIATEHSDA